MSPPRYFEDFHAGQKFTFGGYDLTKEKILAFARAFDPQPHHLDEEAASQTLLGGLSASGWQVGAIAMRLCAEHLLNHTHAAGGTGVDECRWLKPARPGDILRLEVEIVAVSPHPRRPVGFVKMAWNLFNQREKVAHIVTTPIIARRSAGA
ncbi:MAG TPA: MaoC family dehydratase [Rhizomicrobium sp.]|jgi:acyl dehydratase|nr:MaoC family dehydratase [Rhizomicrobium sp.]